MANPPCPCGSGLRLHLCCGPYLRGDREPPDAEALMRSRFSAFALRNVDHLWRTLHPAHPDRQGDEATARKEIAEAARNQRFLRLTILDRRLGTPVETSLVLFHARIFQAGREQSFVEASTFRHDGTGWRYLSGDLRPPQPGWEKLTLADFDR